jgi:Zn-dependent protease
MNDTASTSQARPMGTRAIHLFRVAGIRIDLDYSWFLIFLLVLWSLSVGYFPRTDPDQTTTSYWIAGLLATLLFFLSILAHELSHALVALRSGIEIPAITLFLFGGVSHMERQPQRPVTEMRIAIVGPLTSLALALGFWALYVAGQGALPSLISSVLGYLAWINAALAVFNLLPGFPLDGGRVFRAIVWWRTGSLERATKLAADVGRGFALGLMVLGALQIFAGALLGGLWMVFIGMFLRGMATTDYQNLMIRRALDDVTVEQVMIHDVVSVRPDLPIRKLIDDYFLAFGYRGFPVMTGDRLEGLISVADVKDVPGEDRDRTTVRERMRPLDSEILIAPEASLTEALKRLVRADVGRLIVMRSGKLVGMITTNGLGRFVELRRVLEES